MTASTDRIERSVHIEAPRSKVWAALTRAGEFCAWFGIDLAGEEFAAGKHLLARAAMTGRGDVVFDLFVVAIEPEHYFAWRWHPFAIQPDVDYSQEPTTLVAFYLTEVEGGTLVRVVETGFDAIPAERRAAAFRANENGWTAQIANLRNYVAER